MELAVHNKGGEWLLNTARFPLVDPTTGLRFMPGTYTKAEVTDWVRLQSAVLRLEIPPHERDGDSTPVPLGDNKPVQPPADGGGGEPPAGESVVAGGGLAPVKPTDPGKKPSAAA